MTLRTAPATTGSPCWLDLGTHDIARSIEFYTSIFDWQAVDQGEAFGHYHVFTHGGRMIAGMMAQPAEAPDGWCVYLASADIDATMARITAEGGTIAVEPMQVGPLGTMAIATGPDAASFGVWQAAAHIGFEEDSIVDAPVWFELVSRDFARSQQFLTGVFGVSWESMSDTPEFRYGQMFVEGQIVAGLMDATTGVPTEYGSFWQWYVGVADADAICAQVVELGGQVLMGPQPSPYGPVAHILDPNGARLMICQI